VEGNKRQSFLTNFRASRLIWSFARPSSDPLTLQRLPLVIATAFVVDGRLDELNYGDLNDAPVEVVAPPRLRHIAIPFPHGESYNQRLGMMREFLEDVKQRYPGWHLLVIGHRATRWGLEVLVSRTTFEDVIRRPFEWRPYWEYRA
jgi:broad specificity phosphatase PhoE